MLKPQVMCGNCGHVFPSEADKDEKINCPNCDYSGLPAGIMRASGFPSLETFTKNWQRSRELQEED